ncbi:hypothetical protein GCM10020367_63430 [Streptomyces sannanensis]|uniref:AAA family ATPase n=1 Tax=Streptomyces sannanensis TaxID=285536 RepID=A0ABP6SKX1_9ACTN
MQAAVTLTPARVPELLLGLATVRPVFLWGAPGIGKSSLVRNFAEPLGLECVGLLGTRLAPEDLSTGRPDRHPRRRGRTARAARLVPRRGRPR